MAVRPVSGGSALFQPRTPIVYRPKRNMAPAIHRSPSTNSSPVRRCQLPWVTITTRPARATNMPAIRPGVLRSPMPAKDSNTI